jgi:hypothetical protein
MEKEVQFYRKICEDASTVKSTTQALLSGEPEYKKLIQTESLQALPELLCEPVMDTRLRERYQDNLQNQEN